MDQPRTAEAPAGRRRWTDSVVVDLVLAILLSWSGGWLGDKLGSFDTWVAGGGLMGLGLAFVIAGCRTSSGRPEARILELYLCLAAVYVGLEVIRCVLILTTGRNPDCGCPTRAASAWCGLSDVGYGLVTFAIPAAVGGVIAWLIRRRQARPAS